MISMDNLTLNSAMTCRLCQLVTDLSLCGCLTSKAVQYLASYLQENGPADPELSRTIKPIPWKKNGQHTQLFILFQHFLLKLVYFILLQVNIDEQIDKWGERQRSEVRSRLTEASSHRGRKTPDIKQHKSRKTWYLARIRWNWENVWRKLQFVLKMMYVDLLFYWSGDGALLLL